ncbi:MAG: hypothetical protein P8Y99_14265 [Calditrichaceae bacterium]|jgi:hypothetical protein
MPLAFSVKKEEGYLICTYTGKITDKILIDSWRAFYESDDWIPGFNEISDISQTDELEVTSTGLRMLAEYAKTMHQKHNIRSIKVAIFAPEKIQYGLSRIYDAMTYNSPEHTRVFDNLEEAEQWIKNNDV